jgi:hypothetical protein
MIGRIDELIDATHRRIGRETSDEKLEANRRILDRLETTREHLMNEELFDSVVLCPECGEQTIDAGECIACGQRLDPTAVILKNGIWKIHVAIIGVSLGTGSMVVLYGAVADVLPLIRMACVLLGLFIYGVSVPYWIYMYKAAILLMRGSRK